MTLLQVLETNSQLSTFCTLLGAMPELKKSMQNEDLVLDTIYTVFAPTNAAFAKLDREVLLKIGKKDNLPVLRKMVRHHFVEDVVTLEDIDGMVEIDTLSLIGT